MLPALGLSVVQIAEQMDVEEGALAALLDGERGIDADMAGRIENWLGPDRGGRAEVWLAQQAAYDAWRSK